MSFFVIGKKELYRTNILFLVSIISAFVFGGCSHSLKKSENNQPHKNDNVVEAESQKPKVTGVSVWLDGGGVRGMFGAGVLKTIQQAGIKINSVYCNETSGIAASAVGVSESFHLIEWNLKKLALNDVYSDSKGLFRGIIKRKSQDQRLLENLEKVFGNKRIEDLRIPIRFWVDGFWVQEGLLSDVVRRSVLDRNPFRAPDEWLQVGNHSVLIHVSTGRGRISSEELYLRVITIKPELNEIPEDDYSMINTVFFQGKKSAEQYLSQIKSQIKNND